MKIFFVGICLSLLATACGKPSASDIEPIEKVVLTNYSNAPIFLQRQDVECRSHDFERNVYYPLHLHLDGKDLSRDVDFSNLIHRLFLRDNQVIERSIYGEQIELVRSSRGERLISLSRAQDITLCPDVLDYAQETVESAGLNAAHFIKKTYTNFTSAVKELNILPVTINISPSIIQSKITKNANGESIKESQYWTDNAIYTPALMSITFLPHSHEMKQLGLNVNFWEVPMIASHEYGHHIFQTIYQSKDAGVSSIGCFGHLKEKKISLNKDSKFRVVKPEEVMIAYNEAFADLISYYTLGQEERSVKGIKCLQVTRDVGSSTLVNGKKKVLNKDVIQTYFSHFEDYSNCDEPSFQENHVLGAILAHSMNSFMGNWTFSNDEKLRVLVKWVEYLRENRPKLRILGAQNFFHRSFSAFIEITLEHFDRSPNAETCKAVQRNFPGVKFDECESI